VMAQFDGTRWMIQSAVVDDAQSGVACSTEDIVGGLHDLVVNGKIEQAGARLTSLCPFDCIVLIVGFDSALSDNGIVTEIQRPAAVGHVFVVSAKVDDLIIAP